MPLWLIPMVYTVASVATGLILPRAEHVCLASFTHGVSVGSALAFFSSVSSGMMALTGIVFAIAFVVVQFSALTYSRRWSSCSPTTRALYHTLGIFFATFAYSLAALSWTDRGGSGEVPLFSTMLVIALLVVSMLAFSRLIRTVNDLQIYNVLHGGERSRVVIRTMSSHLANNSSDENESPHDLAPVKQTLIYSGEPRVIARFDIDALVRLAQSVSAVVAI